MAISHYERCQISFEDGSLGVQVASVHDDGSRDLEEVVITREPDGSRCRQVYARQSSLQDCVFGFSDLHGRKWSVVPGSTKRQE